MPDAGRVDRGDFEGCPGARVELVDEEAVGPLHARQRRERPVEPRPGFLGRR